MRNSELRGLYLPSIAQASICSEKARRFTGQVVEHPVKMRERLEAHHIGDLADPQVRV
jgi:hypothetical protein